MQNIVRLKRKGVTHEEYFSKYYYEDSVPSYDSDGKVFPAYITCLCHSTPETGQSAGTEDVNYVVTHRYKGEKTHQIEVLDRVITDFPLVNLDEFERI